MLYDLRDRKNLKPPIREYIDDAYFEDEYMYAMNRVSYKRRPQSSLKAKPTACHATKTTVGARNKKARSAKTILTMLVEKNVFSQGSLISCVNLKTDQITKSGNIKGGEIKCACSCKTTYDVGKFQLHAGNSKDEDESSRPYENIIVNGQSLLHYLNRVCSFENMNNDNVTHYQVRREDHNDIACMVCAHEGDLVCCDGCSSTVHPQCMNVSISVEQSWYCPYCLCKFCGRRFDAEHGFLTCFQCDKKYHSTCTSGTRLPIRGFAREDVVRDRGNPLIVTFCSLSCQRIYDTLQFIIGVKQELPGDLSWTLIRRMHRRAGAFEDDVAKRIVIHSKLLVAWSIMNEGFETLTDSLTDADLIRSVVFNSGFRSNYTRLNHSGFYTLILEKGEEVVSVANLRIHGIGFAEMPFITTQPEYRMMNMGRKLLEAVESILRMVEVKKLVLPSTVESESMWRTKFMFRGVEAETMRELSQWNIFLVQSTVLLYKLILPLPEQQPDTLQQLEEPDLTETGHLTLGNTNGDGPMDPSLCLTLGGGDSGGGGGGGGGSGTPSMSTAFTLYGRLGTNDVEAFSTSRLNVVVKPRPTYGNISGEVLSGNIGGGGVFGGENLRLGAFSADGTVGKHDAGHYSSRLNAVAEPVNLFNNIHSNQNLFNNIHSNQVVTPPRFVSYQMPVRVILAPPQGNEEPPRQNVGVEPRRPVLDLNGSYIDLNEPPLSEE